MYLQYRDKLIKKILTFDFSKKIYYSSIETKSFKISIRIYAQLSHTTDVTWYMLGLFYLQLTVNRTQLICN